MAWLALAERNREQARAGFEHVLTIAPDNEEAKIGLSMAPDVYRYLLDTTATMVSTSQGTSWGFGARGRPASRVRHAGAGRYHFTNELQTVSEMVSPHCRRRHHRRLPSADAAQLCRLLGLRLSRPPTASLIEHSIDGELVSMSPTGCAGSAATARPSAPPLRWPPDPGPGQRDGVTPSSEVNSAVPDSGAGPSSTGTRRSSFVVGSQHHLLQPVQTCCSWSSIGYRPLIDRPSTCTGMQILPVADRIALQLIAAHNSFNADTRVTAGLRFTW